MQRYLLSAPVAIPCLQEHVQATVPYYRVWLVFVACLVTDGVRAIKYQVFRGTPDSVRVFLKEAANAVLFGIAVWRVFVVCQLTDGVRVIKYQVHIGTPDSVRDFTFADGHLIVGLVLKDCHRGVL